MLRIKDKSKGVPDQYRYTHRETGWISRGVSFLEMWSLSIGSVVNHRKANGLPPITEAEAEDQLCRQIHPEYCQYDEGETGSHTWTDTRLRMHDIIQGTKAYLALIVSGFKTVSQEEANRRGKICASCYLKVAPQGCATCVKLSEHITGDIATKKTPYDDMLVNLACAVCKCSVKAIVHFPLASLEKTDDDAKQEAFPSFCWRRRDGENYQP